MKIKTDRLANVAPRVATRLLKGFSAYSRHYLLQHFHAIRILWMVPWLSGLCLYLATSDRWEVLRLT
jgi:hypothetical protein